MNPKQTSTPRFKRAAALAAVGVAIPVLAFFVGSQSGGGDLSIAQAAKASQAQNGYGGGPPRNPFDNDEFVEELAAELGVTTDALQNALDDALPTPPTRKEMRAKRAAELTKLAEAMGVSVADLKAALKQVAPRGGRRGNSGNGQRGGQGDRGQASHRAKRRHGQAGVPPARVQRKLARILGIDVSKVKAAFEQARDDREAEMKARHEKFISDLATALGIDASDVEDALEAMRPDGGPGGGPEDGPGEGGPNGGPDQR